MKAPHLNRPLELEASIRVVDANGKGLKTVRAAASPFVGNLSHRWSPMHKQSGAIDLYAQIGDLPQQVVESTTSSCAMCALWK